MRHKKKISPVILITFILLLIYCFAIIIPLLWDLLTSFKSFSEYELGNVLGFPKKTTFINYITVWNKFVRVLSDGTEIYIERIFLNTALYAVGCALTSTIVPCITAYVTSRFNFKFNKVVYTIVIVTMVMPIVGSLPSQIKMAQYLKIFDHIWGLWLMKANFLGMYYLVFFAIFSGIPKAYEEAAKMEGAGNFAIMFRIMLPLVKNTFNTVLLLQFILFWNDWMTPWVLIPSYPTISVGLMYFTSFNYSSELKSAPIQTSACMVVFLPVFIVFLIFSDKLMGNLTMGGIKG